MFILSLNKQRKAYCFNCDPINFNQASANVKMKLLSPDIY